MILVLFLILIITVTLFGIMNNTRNLVVCKEGFNEQTGQFCPSCVGKTFNQCLQCFNCGWCVDKWGNGACIGGDANQGPYNKENCAKFYHTDPFVWMKQINEDRKCSYGPSNANRVLGIEPCNCHEKLSSNRIVTV